MSRGDRVFIGGAVIALALALIFGWFLQPEQPKLAGDSGYQKRAASYRAGGSDCEPAKIQALPVAQRLGKADACREAQEERREAANNFIENRRAAIAAEASAVYTAAQARIEAWGAAVGLLTLFAAAAAAFFAMRAAEHTESNATTAEKTLKHQREMAEHTDRAYLDLDDPTFGRWPEGDGADGKPSYEAHVKLRNYGKTPAIAVLYRSTLFTSDDPPPLRRVKSTPFQRTGRVSPSDAVVLAESIALDDHSREAVKAGANCVWLIVEYFYSDIFERRYSMAACFGLDADFEWYLHEERSEKPVKV